MAEKEKKQLNLDETLKKLDKDYGKGSVLHGNEFEGYTDVVSTGSLTLDDALGINGLPLGKVVELYGWESSGKSTVAQTIIANAQKQGLKCLYVDGENSLDEKYATRLGINLPELYLIQLDEHGGEGAYNKMEQMVETGEIQLVVIDSYNSLQPKSVVIDGEIGDSAIGKHARMMGQVVSKANFLSQKYNCLFIFIGQIREKIGVMFGSPETTQGGNALRFYAHIRLRTSKSILKDGDEAYGNKTKVKVEKNKLAPPFKTAEFIINFGEGIDVVQELIDMASDREVIKVWGKTVTYNDIKYVTEEFPQLLRDNPELFEEIKSKLRQ
jgi:recombination protein RecA